MRGRKSRREGSGNVPACTEPQNAGSERCAGKLRAVRRRMQWRGNELKALSSGMEEAGGSEGIPGGQLLSDPGDCSITGIDHVCG